MAPEAMQRRLVQHRHIVDCTRISSIYIYEQAVVVDSDGAVHAMHLLSPVEICSLEVHTGMEWPSNSHQRAINEANASGELWMRLPSSALRSALGHWISEAHA